MMPWTSRSRWPGFGDHDDWNTHPAPGGGAVTLTIPALVCSTDQLTDFASGACPGVGATAVDLGDLRPDGAVGVPGSQTYTFGNWMEVLAMLYGGQNNVVGPMPLQPDGRRNPARINCASRIRKLLADQYGTLFPAAGLGGACGFGVSGGCRKLKHAFRLADGPTTAAFVRLVGMIAVPRPSPSSRGFPRTTPKRPSTWPRRPRTRSVTPGPN